jgi:hypothetical protein
LSRLSRGASKPRDQGDMRHYSRAAGIVARRIAGEMVLVSTAPAGAVARAAAGSFFVLNASGEALWEALEEVRTFDDLARILRAEFDIDTETAVRDLEAFLTESLDCGVILVREY